ncbi:MAG: DinB family protein [Vicinamibacterales bacterium]
MDRTLDSTLLHITRLRLTVDYPGQIQTCLDALSEDQIWWRPHEQANAVGNLVLHLIGSNHYYVEHAIGEHVLDRERAAEFTARATRTKSDLQAGWDASVRRTQAVLEGLTPSQMAQATERTGRTTTFAQILLHVSHHNATHMGQVVWITKMLAPGAFDDLWMKMRTK